ncbi:hypothetical protein BRC91_03580 [Halobacteriales archaeon QS_4_62_28]|nr:MAG: hypothetical protein BRC91_03580 [Halobacteriales archaeon QS_4_62_28]
MLRAVLLAALLVVAGCQAPTASSSAGAQTDATSPSEKVTALSTTAGEQVISPPDPATDRLGWENGYWYNETLSANSTDGLNESELDAVASRAMARIETIREREFESTVPVSVINRSTYQNRSSRDRSDAFRRFDNGKFEALFLIGEQTDSIAAQNDALSQNVLGFYNTNRDEIVVVADSQTPRLNGERILAHELVHALQDQQFDLRQSIPRTRDGYQGRNALVEGDATVVEQRYMARCGDEWSCLDESESRSNQSGDTHFGLNFLQFFPYSDGPGFVRQQYRTGGWDAVDAAYEDVPDGATEALYPERYPGWEPANVSIDDRSNENWKRIRPMGRSGSDVVGQSAIGASLAYTVTDDYNTSRVVTPGAVVNYEGPVQINESDPYNYDLAAARGWTGGKMFVYENDGGELGYVWKTRWENASEATEFARTWEQVIRHWGGQRVSETVWRIDDGPFEDAIRIERRGATVTVVNAPTETQLTGVHETDA